MRFTTGVFEKRLNRFLVRVATADGTRMAHLPNSGRLTNALKDGCLAYLVPVASPSRKTEHDLFAVIVDDIPVVVDARFANEVAAHCINGGLIEGLEERRMEGREVMVNGSRFDFMLNGKPPFYLEVKCVTHVVDGCALFPDAPTLRGRHHVELLGRLTSSGFGAGLMFVVQRPDADLLKPNWSVDQKFCETLDLAMGNGLKVFSATAIMRNETDVEVLPNKPLFSVR